MNFRPAPLPVVLAVKRRLETSNPGARLDEESVRLVAIPQTHFDATIFLFEHAGKVRLVAELARDGLPHVYAGKVINVKSSRTATAAAIIWAIAQLGWRILNDPRFGKNIVRLNGFAPSLSV